MVQNAAAKIHPLEPAPSPSGALQRVAIIGPSGSSLRRLRDGLIGAIVGRRHSVTCLAETFDDADRAALVALGARCHAMPTEPPSALSLFAARRSANALTAELAAWRPHAVLIYGSGETTLIAVKAAHRAGIRRIVSVVNSLPTESGNTRALRALARTLELVDGAVFHNGDDPKSLRKLGVLPGDLAYVIVPGAGVDLAYHTVQPLPPLDDGLVFQMISRLDRAKGVLDFCAAARLLKARAPSARFRLAGPPGQGAAAVSPRALDSYLDCVEVAGSLDDVRPTLGSCHVYVYPSHAEGMPRSVLEALAAGRPVVTTNVSGCRETVDERVNGCLVPRSDPQALAAAMEGFLKRPDLIPAMARASRSKAERRFDARPVNATLMDVLGL